LHADPPAPSARSYELRADLDAVILRCLEKDPQARWQDATALRTAILACTDAREWDASRASSWWAQHRVAFRAYCEAQRRMLATVSISATPQLKPAACFASTSSEDCEAERAKTPRERLKHERQKTLPVIFRALLSRPCELRIRFKHAAALREIVWELDQQLV
jgi:hypothetical protein